MALNERVTVVTVTFNRTQTLKKCIQALLNQSRPVDDIIVVDNHSNENESVILRDIEASDSRIHLLVLDENRGGAGGFEAGMKIAAAEYPADWYWLMDDDAYPRQDCLEQLLKAKDKLPFDTIGFLAPLIFGLDLQKYQFFQHGKLTKKIYRIVPVAKKIEELQDLTPLEVDAFVGPLISKEAVRRHGVADGSLFIYGDDMEFTYRVTRDMPGYLVKSAVIDHQDAPVLNENMSAKGWWKEYYGNRNRFFFIRKFKKNRVERYISFVCFIMRLFAIMIKSILKHYHILRIRLIWKAICDGLQNRRGKQIDPAAYMRYLKENGII